MLYQHKNTGMLWKVIPGQAQTTLINMETAIVSKIPTNIWNHLKEKFIFRMV